MIAEAVYKQTAMSCTCPLVPRSGRRDWISLQPWTLNREPETAQFRFNQQTTIIKKSCKCL